MFRVGGRKLELTVEQVAEAMNGLDPDAIREHVVEVGDAVFPPKQVLAAVTGWDRGSFTTHEAQRVLSRLGFACHRAGRPLQPAGPRRQTHVLHLETAGLDDAKAAELHIALLTVAKATGHLSDYRSTSLVREFRQAQKDLTLDYRSAPSPKRPRS